jgi:hypothetical protein
MTTGYQIAPDGRSIRCLACGCTSHNWNDVKMRYCPSCHRWLDECCDFCSGHFGFAHDYIAAGRISGVLTDGRPLQDGDGLWAACMVCTLLIEAKAWEPLISRIAAMHKWEEKKMRPRIIFMYKAVFGREFTVSK